MLSHPVIAGVLGLAVGVGLLIASRMSFHLMTAEDSARGLAIIGAALVGRLLLATVVLFGYHELSPIGFPVFGLALAGSFIAMYTVELVRFAGLHRYARPVAGPRDGR